jgi:hypothetical protein
VLNATVETGGAEVIAGFEIGTKVESNEGPGGRLIPKGETKPVHISAKVTGLQPKTVYFFRAGAMGGGGAIGEYLLFETPQLKGLSVNPATKQFEALSYPAKIGTLSASLKVTIGEAKANCNSGGFSGSLAAASSTLSISPTLTGCTFLGESATIKPNSCGFTLSPESSTSGSVGISCGTAGDGIEIVSAACTVRFAQQSPVKGSLSYTSEPGENGLVIVKGNRTFAYTKSGPLCGVIVGTAQLTFEGLLIQV